MSRPGLTALVTTYNEEENLPACLRSLSFADELYVVDSYSTDRTVEIAKAAGARVEQHEYENPARQKNWAIPRASHEWILLLDADERARPELVREIEDLLRRGPDADGYWIGRDNYFLGRRVRRGGWETDTVIRLFRRDVARYDDREVHEEIQLPPPLPTLHGRLEHHTFRSFSQYFPKLERYSRWGASQAFALGRRAGAGTVVAHTVARFLKMYVMRGGFLEGGRGVVLAQLSCFSVYLKYARLWELTLRERGDIAS
jgi:glycosyltransferase involved in cell wall biosynthesis